MTNTETRIKLTDTMMNAAIKLSEGNPGAATVISNIIRDARKIDPNDDSNGFFTLLELDYLGIYGPRIWMLYKDVCGTNLPHMLGLLRACCKLDIISKSVLDTAIDNRGRGLNVEDVFKKVQEHLPNFSKQ